MCFQITSPLSQFLASFDSTTEGILHLKDLLARITFIVAQAEQAEGQEIIKDLAEIYDSVTHFELSLTS